MNKIEEMRKKFVEACWLPDRNFTMVGDTYVSASTAELWHYWQKCVSLYSPESNRAPRIFIDMDGVIVDFEKEMKVRGMPGEEMKLIPGIYANLDPIPGAINGVFTLLNWGYEVWIATKPPTSITSAYADKAAWVIKHLPELKRNIIITHDKGLLGTANDYLIDDRPHKANIKEFAGTFIPFVDGMTWDDVLKRFSPSA